jgi:hypothetical protein
MFKKEQPMKTQFKNKHTGAVVTEICLALVQSQPLDIYHGQSMVLYRAANGDNWVRETKEFMERFNYVAPAPHVGVKPYWTHKKKGGQYQVIADPVVNGGWMLEEMETVVCFEYEDGRKCAMGKRQFVQEFNLFQDELNPKEGQFREVADGRDVFMGGEWRKAWRTAPIWFKAPHNMTIDGVEVVKGDNIALEVDSQGVITSRFSPFVPENVNINVDIKVPDVNIDVDIKVPDVNGFKASQGQMAAQVAAAAKMAVNRSGGYKYVSEYIIPLPKWTNNPGISTINGKTPEEFAKRGDIYKDVANHLQLEMRAQHAQNFVQYYKDGITHVAFVKRMGHKGVPIRGDNLEEVMNAASALLYARVG